MSGEGIATDKKKRLLFEAAFFLSNLNNRMGNGQEAMGNKRNNE